MKFVVVVCRKENEKRLERELVAGKYPLTRLESRGGFLKQKNATFILGIDDNRLPTLMELIQRVCATKDTFVSGPVTDAAGLGDALPLNGAPQQVTVGGAIVFVLPVERFEKF